MESKRFLATPEPPDLGPGPRPGVQDELALEKELKLLFVSEEMPVQKQQLVRALVLLWHDHLDLAHEIAQDIATPDGSFLHAIMHRREPDYGNAKYWFHRVGKHPAYPRIAAGAGSFLNAPENGELRHELLPAENGTRSLSLIGVSVPAGMLLHCNLYFARSNGWKPSRC